LPPVKLPKLVTVLSRSPNAPAVTAVVSATTRKTSTSATLTNSNSSIVWYTTGEADSAMPIRTIAPIAIAFALPPPNRNVVIVAALVAHAGQMFGTIAHAIISSPTMPAQPAVRDNVHSYGSGGRTPSGDRAPGEGAAGGDGPLAA
jgi:hypothetical protein